MKQNLAKWALLGMLSTTSLGAFGCAQEVGDINRVQPNYWSKADFKGVWYTRQTVTEVPGTEGVAFVGIASGMEKIRWEVQESYLIAYRAYERIPGYDQNAGEKVDGETKYRDGFGEGRQNEEYKENVVAAYPIRGHFDIQRAYNTATGEQTNLIVENYSDRPWHDRDYMRVDWSRNLVVASFPSFIGALSSTNFFVQENEGGADAFYHERRGQGDEDVLGYFDFISKMTINGGNELKVRTSFARLEKQERDYEPVYYDDDYMTKFGYFRTERYVYDRKLGFHDRNYMRLANRHDLWKNDFKTDANGEWVRDAEDRRIPTPMAERESKPVVYYLSPNFPEDLVDDAMEMQVDWDRAFRRTIAAVKNVPVDQINDNQGFVLCHNPVTAEDPDVCDPRDITKRDGPFEARAGDLRRSFVFWVHQPQAAGPLGYGPSFGDPETGELVSGTAYVYGASVDTYAQSGVNIVRFANGEFSEEEIRDGDDVLPLIQANFDKTIDPRGRTLGQGRMGSLGEMNLDQGSRLLLNDKQREVLDLVEKHGYETIRGDLTLLKRTDDALKAAGFDQLLLDDEMVRGLSDNTLNPTDMITGDVEKFLQENNPLDLQRKQNQRRERLEMMSKHNVYMAEFADEAVIGTALQFKDEKDYDKIWRELRGAIFRGVMAHEVGHTLGLRHNFQGSWDSINYFDKYWELRKENFRKTQTIDDLYAVNALTQSQIDGDMTRFQYSSIMDYHSRFNSDISGIGKYDEAAIIFAYSTGTYEDLSTDNTAPWPQEGGYVETFADISTAAQLELPGFNPIPLREYLHGFDDRFAASQHPLEDIHYTNLITDMGGPDALKNRTMVRYSELQKLRETEPVGSVNRPLEVQYMFCSDEWAGATISCDRWDLGSDPFELVQWSIRRYESYYPFTHFRRGRLFFNSASGGGAAYRSFATMPFVYQQWFFNQQQQQLDSTLGNYFTIAAYSGLNFLKDVVTRPDYGSYRFNAADNEYELMSFDPELVNQDVALRVMPGEGRRKFSRFDQGSGYYFFTRTVEAGHFWDYLYAMQAITASSAAALGVDRTADFRTFSLPYFLMFSDPMTDLFNGIFQRDNDAIAPRVIDGKLVREPMLPLASNNQPFDPFTGVPMTTGQGVQSAPVDIRTTFAQRIYSLIYSVALFNSNFSQHYVDQARLFRLGGDQVLPAPGDDYEIISFTDPTTRIGYGAIVPATGPQDTTMAGQLILRARALAEQVKNGDNNARFQLDQVVEDIGMVMRAVNALGNVPL